MKKAGKILLFLLPGFLIELSQLFQLLVIGYTLRVIDVNDLICNAAGTVIGYFIFRAVRSGISILYSKEKQKKGHFAEYFMRR